MFACRVERAFAIAFAVGMAAHRTLKAQSGDLAQKHPQDLRRVRSDGARDHDELDHVEPSLAAFVFGNKTLRLTEALGELLLSKAGFIARTDQQLAQCELFGG